jgi:DNA-directed RNA polymerase sigma subunit (sigma70/sigma32)
MQAPPLPRHQRRDRIDQDQLPDLEPWELKHTCALDVADRGGITLEEIGEVMNLTRERIRQVEVRGLLKLKVSRPMREAA